MIDERQKDMDDVIRYLDQTIEMNRLRRELNVMSPENVLYEIKEQALNRTKELLGEGITIHKVNVGYSLSVILSYNDSKRNYVRRIFDSVTDTPAVSGIVVFLSEKERLELMLAATDPENDYRGIERVSFDLPGVNTGDEVTVRFYMIEEGKTKIRIISRGETIGEKNITLPSGDYLNAVTGFSLKQNTDHESKYPPVIQNAFDAEGLVGMEQVKDQLNTFYNTLQNDKIRGVSSNEKKGYNFVITGNPGTGKTVVSRLIGKILYEMGILRSDQMIETDREGLVGQYIGETAGKTKELLDKVKKCGGVLFIDEAYELYKAGSERDFGTEAITTLLKDVEDHRGEYTVILAGYKKQMENMLENANPGFKSRFQYKIHIPDYTDDEMVEAGKRMLEKTGLYMQENAEKAFRTRIEKEHLGDTFANIRTVRDIIQSAKSSMDDRLAKAKKAGKDIDWEDYYMLRAEDFGAEVSSEQKNSLQSDLDELNGLIGLPSAKRQVKEMIDAIRVNKTMIDRGVKNKSDLGTLHMIFLGNAGTGKTTVARLIGSIYRDLGILKRGQFVECSASDLIGRYVGESGKNVQNKIKEALGGVLFIDEAYILGHQGNYNQEALDALIADVENHREEMAIILAGYSDQMADFLNSNQGLQSRFPNTIIFEDYADEELVMIAKRFFAQKNLKYSPENDDVLMSLISMEKDKVKDFGNARGVRNVVEKIEKSRNSRLVEIINDDISDDELMTVTREDIEKCMMR